ncbi:hypothetical protein SAMN06297421_107100 [Aristaeella hokkaidonensis]|nr:hypothetical protein SAMN06297421_107100 [Aristaeella hokkaidonensis]
MTIKTSIMDIVSRLKIEEDSVKRFYETAVNAVIEEYAKVLAIDSLNEIIITDRLTESIKVYQYEHELIEEVTENEFGIVFGKTICDIKTNKQTVFLDAYEMLGLMDNDSLNRLYQDNEEQKREAFVHRDHLINLLIHELSHVEYNSQIITEIEFPKKNSFDLYHEGLAKIMFEEYYACRRASEVSIPFYDKSLKKIIVDIEIKVEKLVQKLRRNELKAVEFIKCFQEYLQLSLKYLCYLLGDVVSNKNVNNELKDTNIQVVIECINREFDDLYKSARASCKVIIPLSIQECVFKYYKMFGVYFFTDEYGIRIKYLDNR